jgi:hypothetical protein
MFTNAQYPLGYKGPTTSPSHEKGMQAAFADLTYDVAGDKQALSHRMVEAVWVRQTGGTAIAPGSVVKWSVPGTEIAAVAGSAEVGCGVVDPNVTASVAQNEYCWIVFRGPVKVLSSAAISANAPVGTAASGKAVTTNYSSPALQASFGRQITAATDADQLRRTLVDFRDI